MRVYFKEKIVEKLFFSAIFILNLNNKKLLNDPKTNINA